MRRSELHVDEVFRAAWAAFKPNAGAFMAATAMAAVLVIAAVAAAFWLEYAQAMGWIETFPALALGYVLGILSSVVGQVLYIGFARMSLAAVRGEPVAASQVFEAGDALVPAFVAGLITQVFVAIGACMCIVPGVIVGCATALTMLFVVDKRLLPLAAIRASVAATRDRRMAILVVWLTGFVLFGVGLLALGVGVLVAVPVFGLAEAVVYERLWPAARPDA